MAFQSKYQEMLANAIQLEGSGFDPKVFTQEGVLVELEVKRWRGKVKLLDDDLGLQRDKLDSFDQFLGDYVTLGQKSLLPRTYAEKLASVETQSRANLKDECFDSPWGKFVPLDAFDRFMDANELNREKFMALRDEIDADYDDILTTVEQDYKTLAGVVWCRTKNIELKRGVVVPADFLASFVQAVISQIPPRQQVFESFIYNTIVMQLPDLVSTIDSFARPRESEPERDGGELEASSGRSRDEVRESMKESVRRSVLGEDGENLDTFMTTVVSRLREIALGGSSEVLASIDRNDGKLVGRASVRARGLIDELRRKDFYGDSVLRGYVDRLDGLLAGGPKDRSVIEIRQALTVLRDYSSTSLDAIAQVPRKAQPAGSEEAATVSAGRRPRKPTKAGSDLPVTVGEGGKGGRTAKKEPAAGNAAGTTEQQS